MFFSLSREFKVLTFGILLLCLCMPFFAFIHKALSLCCHSARRETRHMLPHLAMRNFKLRGWPLHSHFPITLFNRPFALYLWTYILLTLIFSGWKHKETLQVLVLFDIHITSHLPRPLNNSNILKFIFISTILVVIRHTSCSETR